MDSYTEKTRDWLEKRFNRGVDENKYFAHRPIYGYGVQPSETQHTARMAMALSTLRVLNKLNSNTLADLGGGEGYIAALARDFLGYKSMLVELPQAACDRAAELFALPGMTADIHDLPFDDGSIDVVTICEVIEHLRDPLKAFQEAWRVAKNAIIITTQEAYPWAWERWFKMQLRDLDKDHAERTFFHGDDFLSIFGKNIQLLNSCLAFPLEDESKLSIDQARQLVPQIAELIPFGPGSYGVTVVIVKNDGVINPDGRISDEELIEKLFDFKVPLPNVSRAKEVKKPRWVKMKGKKYLKKIEYDLSSRWSQSDKEHINKFQQWQERDPESSKPLRMLYKLMLVKAAALRLLLSPGKLSEKIAWAMRILDKDKLNKILNG